MKKKYKPTNDAYDSKFEEDFHILWKTHSRYPIIRHHKVTISRTWEIDFAFPDLRIAIELQGHGGGHLDYLSQLRDITKHNDLLLAGWTMVYFMSKHLNDVKYITSTLDTLMERKHGPRIRDYRNNPSQRQQPNNLAEAARRLAIKKSLNSERIRKLQ